MIDAGPKSTFRGLPLTVEQDAEVRHYIRIRTRRGLPWDTSELSAMLKDMLHPRATAMAIAMATMISPLRQTRRERPPSARRPPSTKRWTRSRRMRSGTRPWSRRA